MQIKLNLNKFGKIRLQKTAYIVDTISDQKYFKFQRDKFGPYDHSIDIISRNIKEYQKFHKTNTIESYSIAYNKLTSEYVNKKLEIFMPYIKKVGEIINKIEDNEVECLATTMFLIEEAGILKAENIIKEFRSWSEDKSKRFSENDILNSIEYAEKNGLIEKTLVGYKIAKY